MGHPVHLVIDGQPHDLTVDPRTTLLDALRDHLGNMSPKKGCDHGQCGACTVLVDGRRLNSCLLLAVSLDGAEVLTSDGLAPDGDLSVLHTAFLEYAARSSRRDNFNSLFFKTFGQGYNPLFI